MRQGYSPTQRKILFFGVCIPTRIALGLAAIYAGRQYPKMIASVALLGGIVAIIMSVRGARAHDCRWWSSRLDVATAMFVVAVSVFVLVEHPDLYTPSEAIGAAVLIRTLIGLGMSIQKRPWTL